MNRVLTNNKLVVDKFGQGGARYREWKITNYASARSGYAKSRGFISVCERKRTPPHGCASGEMPCAAVIYSSRAHSGEGSGILL